MKNIIFFGDSLTAGYGLLKAHEDSIPALIQAKINALELDFKVINAGRSGDTSAGGLQRIAAVLAQPIAVFVLELGANDMLRGIPPQQIQQNLQAIVDQVKVKYPAAQLMLLGMELPAWVPGQRAAEFRGVFTKVAKDNQMALVPFFLEGVAGVKHLNLQDGLHPLAEGYKIIAANIWPTLKKLIMA